MNKDAQQILDSLITRAKTMQYTVIYNELKKLKNELKKQNQNGNI